MTILRKKDGSGKWSPSKITLLCTVVVAVCACIGVASTVKDDVKEGIAPWTSLPETIKRMDSRLARIEETLQINAVGQQDFYITNRQMRTVER